MAISFKDRVAGLSRHLKRRTRRIFNREEDKREALAGMAKEAGRFVKHMIKPGATRDRKQAVALVNKGKDAYNAAEYKKAEKYFKKSLSEDPSYARAWMYLGNTYYKEKLNAEAGDAWVKAIEAEPKSGAAEKAREKIKKTGHGQVDVVYAQKQFLKKD